jgi:hypothetical protein
LSQRLIYHLHLPHPAAPHPAVCRFRCLVDRRMVGLELHLCARDARRMPAHHLRRARHRGCRIGIIFTIINVSVIVIFILF